MSNSDSEEHVARARRYQKRYKPPDRKTIVLLRDTDQENKKEKFVFELSNRLGSGTSAVVYAAHQQILPSEHASSPLCWDKAAKIFNLSNPCAELTFENERTHFETLSLKSHPNVVRCFISGVDDRQKRGILILERLPHFTLHHWIRKNGRFSPNVALYIISQIAAGVQFLQRNEICIRDLKPTNIAIDDDYNIKLFDLGLAAETRSNEYLIGAIGTPLYMAPEVLHEEPHNGFLADVWCVGQVFYEMLVGKTMFEYCSNEIELKHRNSPRSDESVSKHFPLTLLRSCDPLAECILRNLLKVNPEERWTISKLVDVLNTFKPRVGGAKNQE
jgi:serine/threonine protein kinase